MNIFISYSRRDKRLILNLLSLIQEVYPDDRVWYDAGIQGGDKWWNKILGEIRNCSIFLFFMSETAIQSEFCQKELREAISKDKDIIPVMIRKLEPEYLGRMPDDLAKFLAETQYVDLSSGLNKSSVTASLWRAINLTKQSSHRVHRMRLTRAERLLVLRQLEILAEMKPDESDDFETMMDILTYGYEWHYDDIAADVFDDRYTMTRDQSIIVVDILDMHRTLKYTYRDLKDNSGIESWKLDFIGFDGNNETRYMAYARFLIEKQRKFEDVISQESSDKFNSHVPMMDSYKKMLEEWNRSPNKYKLTKSDIIRILSAW
jgi:uncharacterized protein